MAPLARGVQRADGEPGVDRLGLALRRDRINRLVLDCLAGGRVGLSSGEDATDRRGRLQPRGGVHDVACNHRLTELRPRPERDQRLAGVDGDPDLHVELAKLVHAVAHRQRGTHRPLGVVAVGRRRAEHGDDRVADELLDHAAERLELPPDELVVRRQEGPDVLRVELFRTRREADEIDEDDRDDAPLIPARGPRAVELLPAREAEPGAFRVLLATVGASDHELRVEPALG